MEKKIKKRRRVLSPWRIVIISIACVVFFAGLLCTLYPLINGWYLDKQAESQVEEFLARVDFQSYDQPDFSASIEFSMEVDSENEIPYSELYAAMQAYNERIYAEKQVGLCDAWSYTNPSFVLEDYGVEDGTMGVVSIPSLDIRLPIYLGATYQHMNDGAAQLSETSLPIGGINTNCVIAGHCGWRGADYFRYLSEVELGAYVYITNLWETLTYQVVSVEVIDPDETNKILIQKGKDMVTLFTCHPYASGGTYRFVAYCERVFTSY